MQKKKCSHVLFCIQTFLSSCSDNKTPNHALLWRYYERTRRYLDAAKSLAILADDTKVPPVLIRYPLIELGYGS